MIPSCPMHLGRLSPCGHVDEPVYISVLPSRLLFSHLALCRRRHPCCTVLLLSCLISSTPIVCVPRHAFLSTQILFRHILSARVLKAHLVIPHTHGRIPSSYHSLLCLGSFLLRISPGCYTVSIPMHVEMVSVVLLFVCFVLAPLVVVVVVVISLRSDIHLPTTLL